MTTIRQEGIRSTLSRWTGSLFDSEESAAPGKPVPKGEDARDYAEFRRKFSELVVNKGEIPAGQINLISLETIKSELGVNWQRKAQKIRDAASRIIASHVGRGDIATPYSADEFLMMLNLSGAAAQLKCLLIAKEIHDLILGGGHDKDLRIRSAVGEQEGELIFEDVRLAELADGAIRITAHEPIDTDRNSLAKGKVLRTPEPEDEIAWPEPKVFEAPKVQLATPSGPADQPVVKFDPKNLEFLYRPVWDAKLEVVSTYMCVPCRMHSDGDIVYYYEVLGPKRSADTMAWLDAMVASEALAMLDELVRNKFNMFVSIPVHFDTLATPRLRSRYLSMFRHVPEGMRKFLALEIHGIPDGVTHGRMAQFTSQLRPLCRAVFARTTLAKPMAATMSGTGLLAIVVDIAEDRRSEILIMDSINALAKSGDDHAVLTSCIGIHSTSLAVAAAAAGCRFISGSRIISDKNSPLHVQRYHWRDFYSNRDL